MKMMILHIYTNAEMATLGIGSIKSKSKLINEIASVPRHYVRAVEC